MLLCMLFVSFEACFVPPHRGVSKLSKLKKSAPSLREVRSALLRAQDEAGVDLSMVSAKIKRDGFIQSAWTER